LKKRSIAIGITAVLCICALLVGPASAAFRNWERGDGMAPGALLDRLEAQGFDVSAIRTAVENGDNETARTLMQQFMEQHKDELPAPPADGNRGMRITGLLDKLEARGVDVSAIRTAVENGDNETARTLMQQFMEEHKAELPDVPRNGCPAGPFGDGGVNASD
jgi:DNA-binding transcriptional MerR regulator